MSQTLLKNKFWAISVLVLLSMALRLPTLGSPLIEDEAISFNRYIDVPWKDLVFYYHDTNQHTLFLLLSEFSIWMFGESEIIFSTTFFSGRCFVNSFNLSTWIANQDSTVLRFDLCSIDGTILATPKIFARGSGLRANNIFGAFGDIFNGSVFK